MACEWRAARQTCRQTLTSCNLDEKAGQTYTRASFHLMRELMTTSTIETVRAEK
jgi:hypothetical protein